MEVPPQVPVQTNPAEIQPPAIELSETIPVPGQQVPSNIDDDIYTLGSSSDMVPHIIYYS